jgi:uncharacterized protein YgiM (DUF1202 family)
MKNLALSLIVSMVSLASFGQSYLGQIKQNVNLRKGPGTSYEVITVLKTSSQVFIYSLDIEGEFYNVIDIKTNEEGYVHKDYVKVENEVKRQEGEIFIPDGKSLSENPEIEITNNTDLTMTLKIGSDKYIFKPQEVKKIVLNPSEYDYMASAPGVVPYYGTQNLNANYRYTWKFYIIRK